MLLGRARLAVQVCSSPGLATRILIPIPCLGSIDLTVAACVVFHLDLYPSCGSDNISVEIETILQYARLLPIAENLTTNLSNLA